MPIALLTDAEFSREGRRDSMPSRNGQERIGLAGKSAEIADLKRFGTMPDATGGESTTTMGGDKPPPVRPDLKRRAADAQSVDDLVQRVLDNARGADRFQLGENVADDFFVQHRVHGHPVGVGQCGDRRFLKGRQQRQHAV